MAIEYPGYIPVEYGVRKAQTHLDWLNTLKTSIEEAQFFLQQLAGGGDGIVAYGASPSTQFEVRAEGTPSMSVVVGAGIAFNQNVPWRMGSDWTSAALTPPSVNPRIDTVEILYTVDAHNKITARAINIITGSEAASPTAPAKGTYGLKIAEIYHRVGEVQIEDADYSGSTEGYITDARTWTNM